jgi:hypothetical protein
MTKMVLRNSVLQAGHRADVLPWQVFSPLMDFAPLAISYAQNVTIGLTFTFFILMPAIATVCIVVAIVSGRGEKADDDQLAGRWGTDSS